MQREPIACRVWQVSTLRTREGQLKQFSQRERANDNSIMHSVAVKMTALEMHAVAEYSAVNNMLQLYIGNKKLFFVVDALLGAAQARGFRLKRFLCASIRSRPGSNSRTVIDAVNPAQSSRCWWTAIWGWYAGIRWRFAEYIAEQFPAKNLWPADKKPAPAPAVSARKCTAALPHCAAIVS